MIVVAGGEKWGKFRLMNVERVRQTDGSSSSRSWIEMMKFLENLKYELVHRKGSESRRKTVLRTGMQDIFNGQRMDVILDKQNLQHILFNGWSQVSLDGARRSRKQIKKENLTP